jgi:uncharacterized membrane protein YphA (DoxX/SURF4 family)
MNKKSILVTGLRMVIGWHFLYEGLWKLVQGGWSAEGYLRTSQWIGSGVFHSIASTPWLLTVVNQLNIWGLIFIGLALLLGFCVRISAVSGILLLALYYMAQPPFLAPSAEGHFLWIDRNVVEAVALLVLCVVPSYNMGSLIVAWVTQKLRGSDPAADGGSGLGVKSVDRRDLLISLTSLPLVGAFGYAFMRKHGPVWERENIAGKKPDAVTSATVKSFQFSDIKDLKKPLDAYGKIGNVKISRMIMGGNLMGGWAHARDLLYTDKLVKAYHSDWRIFRTLKMAEAAGINTVLTNPALMRVIGDYWKKEGGKIQFISDCGHSDGLIKGAQVSVEFGACAVYMHGGVSDNWARDKKVKNFVDTLAAMRKLGVPSGIGAHKLETIQFCVENNIVPDFWMKTFHKADYWSARPQEGHDTRDNLWCLDHEAVKKYMDKLEQPWIAFKIMAAGAIHPHEAFPYAFQSGADFICVGMYDFQIVDDVNLFNEIFPKCQERQRPWRA